MVRLVPASEATAATLDTATRDTLLLDGQAYLLEN
jgi:hypothetical protein